VLSATEPAPLLAAARVDLAPIRQDGDMAQAGGHVDAVLLDLFGAIASGDERDD
jgi:hypothetical protein